jgi:peptidoglycan/LPS O-acetylase OafA/YrhL
LNREEGRSMQLVHDHRSNGSIHLDAIRGIAALAVFLGHGRPLFLRSGFSTFVRTPNPNAWSTAHELALKPRTTIGHEAVIVFFVLSGYFVGGSVLKSMRDNSFRWSSYFLVRLTRLWVVLLPALLLGFAVDSLGMHLLGRDALSIYAGPSGAEVLPGLVHRLTIACMLGNVFFLQDTFVRPFGTNVALWSLACEFWYYALFPLILVLFRRGGSFGHRLLSGSLLIAAMALSGPPVLKYFPLWLAGCAVALIPWRVPAGLQRVCCAIATGVLLVVLVVGLRTNSHLYLVDVAICATFTTLLWIMVQNRCKDLNAAYTWCAQGLARISYTLYATHFPLLVFAAALAAPQWSPQPLSWRSGLYLGAAYAVIFALSVLLYMLFERNTIAVRRAVASFIDRCRNRGRRRVLAAPSAG